MGSCIGRGQSQSPPILYGNLVSVVEQLDDLQGNKGLFFLFPDVSIRWRGRYQLGVTLSRISESVDSLLSYFNSLLTKLMLSTESSGLANDGTFLAQTRTRAFDAVALHQYRAARAFLFFIFIFSSFKFLETDFVERSSNTLDANFPWAGCKNVPQYAIFLSHDI